MISLYVIRLLIERGARPVGGLSYNAQFMYEYSCTCITLVLAYNAQFMYEDVYYLSTRISSPRF